MTNEEIQEYVIRAEGMADGYKQGIAETVKWFTSKFAEEQLAIAKASQAPTGYPAPASSGTGS